MPIWETRNVFQEPGTHINFWQVYEVSSPLWSGRTRHFVGFNVSTLQAVISPAIREYDANRRIGVDAQEHLYRLKDEPGYNGLAEVEWRNWCEANQAYDVQQIDITN